jgi:hypothetical protein
MRNQPDRVTQPQQVTEGHLKRGCKSRMSQVIGLAGSELLVSPGHRLKNGDSCSRQKGPVDVADRPLASTAEVTVLSWPPLS